jgi:hypothetical protein
VARHISLEALDPEQQNGVVLDGANQRLVAEDAALALHPQSPLTLQCQTRKCQILVP